MELLTGTSDFGTFSYWPCDLIGYHIAHGGVWEPELISTFDAIPKGSVVIDVGANIGWWTIYAAKRGSYVYAFEACPEVFSVLKLNVEQNGLADRVSLFPLALYDRCVQLTALLLEESNPAHQRFNDGRLDPSQCYNSGSFQFKPGSGSLYDQYAVPLDFFNIPKVDFIKTDTEGCDLRILKGAEKTIRRSRPVLCYEYLSAAADPHGDSREDFTEYICGLGYDTQQIDTAGLLEYGMFVAKLRGAL